MRNNLSFYPLNERIFLVKTFYRNDSDVNCVKTDYLLEFGAIDDVPSDRIIFDAISLFEETGNISEVPDVFIKNEDDFTDTLENAVSLTDIKVETDFNETDPIYTPHERSESKELLPNIKCESNENMQLQQEITSDVKDEVETKVKRESERRKKKHSKDEATADELPKNPKICTHCKLVLPSKYKLRIHVRTYHKEALEKAKTMKLNKTTRKCPYCPKEWKEKRDYERHLGMHLNKKDAICDVCGKAFRTVDSLSHHMLIHSGEKPFKCDFPKCNRVFRNSNSCVIHKRCHTGEKPYSCEHCGKSFTDKSTLRVHYRQHTGENPYKCEICGKTTKQKQNLKSHMRHMHKMP